MSLYPLGFIEPCLPTVSRTVPTGTGWAYEIKHDGFRSCVRQRERVRVISRGAARLGSADYQRWSTLCWRCPPPQRGDTSTTAQSFLGCHSLIQKMRWTHSSARSFRPCHCLFLMMSPLHSSHSSARSYSPYRCPNQTSRGLNRRLNSRRPRHHLHRPRHPPQRRQPLGRHPWL